MELTKLEELAIIKQARDILKTIENGCICYALDQALSTTPYPDYKKTLIDKYFLKYKPDKVRIYSNFWWGLNSPKRLEVMDLVIAELEKNTKSTKEELKTALKVIEEYEHKTDKCSVSYLKNLLSAQLEPERKTTIIQFEYNSKNKLFLLENIKDYFKKNYWDGYNIKITEFSEKKEIYMPKMDETYYYISGDFEVGKVIWHGHGADKNLNNMGNCFKTESEANAMVDKFKKLLLNVK